MHSSSIALFSEEIPELNIAESIWVMKGISHMQPLNTFSATAAWCLEIQRQFCLCDMKKGHSREEKSGIKYLAMFYRASQQSIFCAFLTKESCRTYFNSQLCYSAGSLSSEPSGKLGRKLFQRTSKNRKLRIHIHDILSLFTLLYSF